MQRRRSGPRQAAPAAAPPPWPRARRTAPAIATRAWPLARARARQSQEQTSRSPAGARSLPGAGPRAVPAAAALAVDLEARIGDRHSILELDEAALRMLQR